jgi:hypothetical protein
MTRYKGMLVVALGLGMAAMLVTSTSAFASLKPGQTVKASLAKGTKMTFAGDIDAVPITVTCKTFKASGKAPNPASDTVTLSAPPTISKCTDSLGGKDTIKTNSTNGSWTLSVSGASAPYTMTLTIPQAGATFTSSVESGCTITAAPSGSAGVSGSYNGTNTDTVSGASIPTSGSGCTSSNATTSATVVLKPAPGAPPF